MSKKTKQKLEIENVNQSLQFLLKQISREMGVECLFRWQSKINQYIVYDYEPLEVSHYNFQVVLIGYKPDLEFIEYLYYKYEKIISDLEKNIELEVEDRKEIKAHKRPRKTVIVKKESRTANGK